MASCSVACPSWWLGCWRIMRGWHCRGCLGYPEEQVQTNLTSLVAWSRRAGQGGTAAHSEVRSSTLTSYGMRPILAEESKSWFGKAALEVVPLPINTLRGLQPSCFFPLWILEQKLFSVNETKKSKPPSPSSLGWFWSRPSNAGDACVCVPQDRGVQSCCLGSCCAVSAAFPPWLQRVTSFREFLWGLWGLFYGKFCGR